MQQYIEKLKDPHLVADIQNFFGVMYIESDYKNDRKVCEKKFLPMVVHVLPESDQCTENEIMIEEHNSGINENTANFSEKNLKNNDYVISNKFWYYLFYFGTFVGDELGYGILIPFWFWNVNVTTGKKIVLVWSCVMYIGQIIKDVVCWPRPSSPPVIRIQKKWSLEYGMPSTHAMVAVSLPSSVVYYSYNYHYPVWCGISFAVLMCILISVSRLYLGMHSILDVIVGIVLSAVLLVPVIPMADALSEVLVHYQYSPIFIAFVCVILIIIYPSNQSWTPTKGDTTCILGTCSGVLIGCWAIYQIEATAAVATYSLPIWKSIGVGALRTILGYVSTILTIVLCDYLLSCVDFILERVFSVATKNVETKHHIPFLDFTYKYIKYTLTAVAVIYLIPLSFRYLHIQRSNYFTEY